MDNVCVHCEYENPIGANFCMSCGKSLPRASFSEHTATMDTTTPIDPDAPVPSPTSNKGIFVIRVGTKRGSRIAIDSDLITIGRHPESDILLDDITVSRRHAEVHRTDTGIEVVDSGSLNGTYVNKELVERGPLTDGDELQVGKFKLVYLELGDDV